MQVREKLFQLCSDVGVKPDLTNFSGRKQLQKLTYMFEVFGLDLGFRFSWYVHGPYDRRLTSVLFNDDKDESVREVLDKFKNEDKKLRQLKKFLGRDIHSSRALELIGSLHYLLIIGQQKNIDDDTIINQLLDLKPQFSEGETRYYLKRIKETNFNS